MKCELRNRWQTYQYVCECVSWMPKVPASTRTKFVLHLHCTRFLVFHSLADSLPNWMQTWRKELRRALYRLIWRGSVEGDCVHGMAPLFARYWRASLPATVGATRRQPASSGSSQRVGQLERVSDEGVKWCERYCTEKGTSLHMIAVVLSASAPWSHQETSDRSCSECIRRPALCAKWTWTATGITGQTKWLRDRGQLRKWAQTVFRQKSTEVNRRALTLKV